ncbi:MAG: hypothetical protein KA206_05635 [Paludibacter sp.]|nr:hypothetical protein [Paludibacter sp.]
MAVPKTVLREQLRQLPKDDLVDMLLKLAGKRYNYEFLLVNFLDPEGGELTLFQEAIDDIQILWDKEFKGRTIQHQLVKRLNACTKRIKEFTVETKSKKLEADLILYVLQLQFEQSSSVFGARFSGYDYKVALLLKKLIGLVTTKLHPDYLLDYQEKINEFLTKIHHTSNRINTVFDLPKAIE